MYIVHFSTLMERPLSNTEDKNSIERSIRVGQYNIIQTQNTQDSTITETWVVSVRNNGIEFVFVGIVFRNLMYELYCIFFEIIYLPIQICAKYAKCQND